MPYLDFDRAAWSRLRAATPLTLGESDLAELRGLTAQVLEDPNRYWAPAPKSVRASELVVPPSASSL